MIDRALQKKIIELFDYRDFPNLYLTGGLSKNDTKIFNDQLIDLQAQIYHLDTYLESNWVLNNKTKLEKWKAIRESLTKLGVKKSEHIDYLKQVRKYETHEIQLRKNLMPTRLNTEYYYFFKSCDVKLMRRLIYEKLPILKTQFKLADWRYFDLVTEVNDDACDLKEDLDTINGNMILIAYYELGRDATIDYFINFLDYCGEQSALRFENDKKAFVKTIHERTLEQIKLTKEILLGNPVLKSEAESLLYKNIKEMK
jgi:hypothetical protein